MVKNKKNKDKKEIKKIATKRVIKLFNMAEQRALAGDFALADRYVEVARKISMKNLVSIPKEYKRSFCKHCYSYLLPGSNSRYRVHRKKLIVFCQNCGKYSRIPLQKKKKSVSAILK